MSKREVPPLPVLRDWQAATEETPKHTRKPNKMQTLEQNAQKNILASDDPAVYVGTYSKYNSGSIRGAWISLEGHSKDSFLEACAELHSDESDPELMFQDYQNFPREFYGESYLADGLWDWLELDEDERKIMSQYCAALGCDGLTWEDARDAFQGTADSFAEFAENTARELGEIANDLPSWIESAIDWESAWNCALRLDYSTSTDDEGMIYFFRNC